MRGFELVAGVIGVFFVTGIVLGVLLVTVLPRFRYRIHRRYVAGGGWHELRQPRGDSQGRLRWPGE